MKRFKHILVYFQPLQANNWVADRAIALAKENDARVTFLASYKRSRFPKHVFGSRESARLSTSVRESTLAELVRAKDSFSGEGVSIRTKVLTDPAFIELTKLVKNPESELVMLEADKHGTAHHNFIGSTAMHLLRKCPCPVWVFKPTQKRRFRRVLVAIDASAESPIERALNLKLLQIAASLCEREAAKLHVVHCWEAYGESVLSGVKSGVAKEELAHYVRTCRATQKAALMDILKDAKLDGDRSIKHFVKGEPGPTIPSLAKKKSIELVIMGTVARTGIRGLLVGNTAERVLSTVGCSVMAVKPDGFVSPVHE